MSNLNITFAQAPGVWVLVCDQLPAWHKCYIRAVDPRDVPVVLARYALFTETQKNAIIRHSTESHNNCRLFQSLEDAKAAAVSYVKGRVAEAKRQEPVHHGQGIYKKRRGVRGWWVAFDAAPDIGWIPAGLRKKDAIALLDNPPQWVKDLQREQNIAENVCGRE